MSAISKKQAERRTNFNNAKALYNLPNGDLILECTARASMDEVDTCTFKVHRQRLAAVSTFFEDMLVMPQARDNENESAPTIRMEESWPEVYVLLGYAYNAPDVIGLMEAGKDWQLNMRAYEAANKYQIHGLKRLASSLLRLSVSDIDDATALIIYGRASLFEDNELASTMLSRAARVPLHQIPRGTLKELSTSALELLINQQKKEVASLLSAVELHCRANLDNRQSNAVLAKLLPVCRYFPQDSLEDALT